MIEKEARQACKIALAIICCLLWVHMVLKLGKATRALTTSSCHCLIHMAILRKMPHSLRTKTIAADSLCTIAALQVITSHLKRMIVILSVRKLWIHRATMKAGKQACKFALTTISLLTIRSKVLQINRDPSLRSTRKFFLFRRFRGPRLPTPVRLRPVGPARPCFFRRVPRPARRPARSPARRF